MCFALAAMSPSDSLPTDLDGLRALLLAERAHHAEELERLTAIIKELQRHRFGRRAERLDPEQLALALEDVEQTLAAADAAAENDTTAEKQATPRRRHINRGALPVHFPREEIVIDVADKTCACCGGLKHRIGEDVSERLDVIPAQFKVIVTRRPKYACQVCAGEVVQAPALERPIEHLAGFSGILQVDGYGAYAELAQRGDVALAFCWSHVRRQFYEIQVKTPAPIATEALVRIAALYAIEADIRGLAADERRQARQRRTKPLVDDLRLWLEAQLAAVSGKSTIAGAIRYALSRWEGLTRFLDDGRIEIDSNVVERSIRPIALGRKNHLFAGSDGGGEQWAVIASLVETCKMNAVDPQAYLHDVLSKIVARHPMGRIDELLPFAYVPAAEKAAA